MGAPFLQMRSDTSMSVVTSTGVPPNFSSTPSIWKPFSSSASVNSWGHTCFSSHSLKYCSVP